MFLSSARFDFALTFDICPKYLMGQTMCFHLGLKVTTQAELVIATIYAQYFSYFINKII
jgi:hypothetical protein